MTMSITVPEISQYIYLDFDGAKTAYHGEILDIDDLTVADSSISSWKIAMILAELNARYAAQGVSFVTERPEGIDYSTIFVGKTNAFDAYGAPFGIAETIDHGNQNHSDNAFVNLDASSSITTIVNTISHEAEHLIGTLDDEGTGLEKYEYSNYFYVLES